ncbi:metal ABC transporter substrate-binding protein [Mycolicibacterium palauense]|uniref:metal ABC transporter substrate-binding protein n=1 Tax=Mycolicibacterium palauense TaxID=2034511 RepID=UPI000BFEB4B2|nr:metal ABC transporter substrate-binding protein [Mycolicibacterium palauense]
MKHTFLSRSFAAVSLAAVVAAGGSACSSDSSEKPAEPGATGDALTVFATTGYLGDAVSNIAPDADVTVMVGPGGDPHTYQPTTQDIEKIGAADLVVWNGLHLEAQMINELEAQGDRQIAAGQAIPKDELLPWPEPGPGGEQLYDPHVWNSPGNWEIVVDAVAKKLGEVDPDGKDTYDKNADAYKKQIEEVNDHAKSEFEPIPVQDRVLITGHDAFNYYGRDYDIDVHATDFVTSEAQLSAPELAELADLIVDRKVPVIFQDNLANPQAIDALKEAVQAKGWDVTVSDAPLYADSLGEAPPVDTYLGVFTHNTDLISEAMTPAPVS